MHLEDAPAVGGDSRERHAKRLKVLVPSYACDANDVGSGFCAFHWVKALSRYCDITLMTRRRNGKACGTEGLANVRTVYFDEPGFYSRHPGFDRRFQPGYYQFIWRSYMLARRELAAEGWDLVHQITPGALRYPSPMVLLGVPFIFGPAGGLHPYPAALIDDLPKPPIEWLRKLDNVRMRYDPFFRGTLRRAARLCVFSEAAVHMLRPEFQAKCLVMPDGGFESLPDEPFRADGDVLEILFVARVEVVKGLKYLLAALARLKKRVRWRLTVVGDGSDLEREKELARTLRIAGRVRFEGRKPREEVDQYYHDSHVFCLPSVREGSGLAILEAMSYGLPVIVCDYGGPSALVTDECGFKIAPARPEIFVKNIAAAIEAFTQPRLRQEMGSAARRRVADHFTWDMRALRMLEIYREVLCEGDK